MEYLYSETPSRIVIHRTDCAHAKDGWGHEQTVTMPETIYWCSERPRSWVNCVLLIREKKLRTEVVNCHWCLGDFPSPMSVQLAG